MTRMRKRLPALLIVGGAIVVAIDAVPSHAQFPVVASCPKTSDPPTAWAGSFLDSNTTKSGTVYNSTGSGRIELARSGENFGVGQTGSSSNIVYAAVGDFNRDGWPDFVGSPENLSSAQLIVMRNNTWQAENCTDSTCASYSGTAPDWNDPTVIITPKFDPVRNLRSGGISGRFAIIGGDFNGDGWDDVFESVARSGDSYQHTAINMYLNQAANDASGNPQFGAAYNAVSGFTVSSVLGKQSWSGTSVQAVDENGDGRLDVIIGTGISGGSIRILRNNCPGALQASGVWLCSANPTFTDGGYLKSNLDTGNTGFGTNVNGGVPTFAFADIDHDGLRDLVVGAPNCCAEASYRIRIFKGCSGGATCTAGLENTASQNVTATGAVTALFIADFSLDGKPDLAYATDNFNYDTSVNGGTAFYYRNNGTSTPFSNGMTVQLTDGSSPTDYDVGLLMDYDQDPTGSPDILVADGNHSGGFYVIADRVKPEYVDCGEAASGVIDLGALLDDEMVVTAARIKPTVTLPAGTSIKFYLSNEEPANWVEASLCTGSTTEYCVNFPKAVGRSVRWKAVMCTDSTKTQSPQLSDMEATFDYTEAREHYRSGVIVNDGVVYAGAFNQPGDRGHFYAINAGLSTVYWDAADKLDAQSDGSRNIYTAVQNLAVRLDFTTANASDPLLQNVLQTPDTTTTQDLITWARSKRFGTGAAAFPLTRLGSVETSTPSILTKPGRPNWYSFVTAIDRQRIETFISQNADRLPLVLFGAKDGMIHAVHTRPTDISNAKNGEEAWAYIPPTVASGMLADYTATSTANVAAGDGTNNPRISSYPDGSPTLVDYHVGAGVFRTVALVAEGNGGKSFSVLDVTETVDPSSESVIGPTPMWSATPGDGDAGRAFSKPAVARVLLGNQERFLAVAATGIEPNDLANEKGRVVSAYDLSNGTLMWKFEAKCAVTSDITVFETDDQNDGDGGSTLNGYADRVVFADRCGYVYKIDPAADTGGNWYANPNMGGGSDGVAGYLVNTTADGTKQYAMFSTAATSSALGQERPIAGTIAARTDSSTRMVLFFGTGGMEDVDPTLRNEFYAVYADTGAIRSKFPSVQADIDASCVGGVCEKFYGGTVVTPEQVIFTRTFDPPVGTGTCELGSSIIQGVALNDDTNNDFVTDFTLAVSSAVMGALYGDAGAIYFATLSGDVARVGTPRAATAGGDTTAGTGQGMGVGDGAGGAGETVGTTAAFSLVGWRVVL